MQSKLFEGILQREIEEVKNLDLLSQSLEPISFAGEPFHMCENALFEWVLREVKIPPDVVQPVPESMPSQNPPPYPDPKNKQRKNRRPRRLNLTPEEEAEIEKIKSDPNGQSFGEILKTQPK